MRVPKPSRVLCSCGSELFELCTVAHAEPDVLKPGEVIAVPLAVWLVCLSCGNRLGEKQNKGNANGESKGPSSQVDAGTEN